MSDRTRPTWQYVGILLIVSSALVGCTGPTTGTSSPSPTTSTLAPGNESTAKGEDPTPVPPEAVLVFATVDADGAAVSASAYVAGVIENGGTCTFTFTAGDAVVTAEAEGLADRATTSCGTVQVPIDQFTSGPWSASVSYTSATISELASASSPLEIP
ncbi:hypothetical protein [Plantibacter sp. LMC-P-059a]|jgi:hypothetical protein|uniref:hypothetical protein n=1 Tax=Plantibacter sp. LMC-P-059a TaxID=3040297 RepID=UPI00254CCF88|nr:hypothetical protein [Plantibacter sp. LMC-P-059a]